MAKKTAYPYSRISTAEQKKGGGLKRQKSSPALADAIRQGYFIDTTWKLVDDGISGRKGKNVSEGKLGVFIRAVEDGRIKKGSALVVENLDRISRQQIRTAVKQFIDMLDLGINIITNDRTFAHDSQDIVDIVIAVILLGGAFEESEKKSVRHTENWLQWADDVLAGRKSKHNFHAKCPNWLSWDRDKQIYRKVQKHVKTIKRIIKLHFAGSGTTIIANRLNDDDVDTLGHGKRWSSGQVKHVLSNKELTGKRQLYHAGKPYGDPIEEFYPQIIDPDTFYQIQGNLAKKSVSTGRRGKKCTNLFTGLITSYQKGKGYIPWRIHSASGHTTIGGPRVEAIKRGNKTIRNIHLPYELIEEALLAELSELDFSTIFKPSKNQKQVQKIQQTIEGLKSEVARIKKRLKKKYSAGLADILLEHEIEIEHSKQRLEDAEIAKNNSALTSVQDVQTLIKNGKSRDMLKAHIRFLVKNIRVELLKEVSEQNRFFGFRINFNDLDYVRLIFFQVKRKSSNKGNDIVRVSGRFILDDAGEFYDECIDF